MPERQQQLHSTRGCQMMRWPVLVLLCAKLLLPPVVATPIIRSEDAVMYTGYKLYRADVFPGQLPIVDSLEGSEGVEVWNWLYLPRNSSYTMDVLAAPDKESQVKEVFDDVKLRYDVVIDDLQETIEIENTNEEPLLHNRFGHPMTWQTYHSFDDMAQYLHYLEQTFPNIVSVLSVGQSSEGRPLLVARVSTGNSTEGNITRPAMWIDGGVHAREWISPAVASYFLQRLVELPDPYTSIVDAFDWYIMPVANPDGYEYSRSHDRLWRKTRSKQSGTNCYGVDLNRNFGFKWDNGGSSNRSCSAVYQGPEPFSEPEARAMRDIMVQIKDELLVYVSIHSYKQLWMYPWGFTKAPLDAPNNSEAAAAATSAINAFAKSDQYKHGSMANLLYVVSGSSNDYAYGELGVPYSFALELRDRGEHGFLLPREQIEPTAEETTVGLFAMAEEVMNKRDQRGRGARVM